MMVRSLEDSLAHVSAGTRSHQRLLRGVADDGPMNTNFRFRYLAPIAVVVAVAAATGCTDSQRRSLGEEDVRVSLRAATEHVVECDGDLDCTSTISTDGAVAGTCTGTSDDGKTVEAVFAGTADVDAERCSADLTVSVDGAEQRHESGTNCFDS